MKIGPDHWSQISEGEVLREARAAAGVSAAWVADKLECSAQTIYNAETRGARLSDGLVAALSDVLPEAWRVIAERRVEEYRAVFRLGEATDDVAERAVALRQSAALVRDLQTIVRAATRQLERLGSTDQE